jgi:hypothetical protein
MRAAVDLMAAACTGSELDCVGHQLSQRGDRQAAFYAATLLRYLRTRHASELSRRWQPSADTSLEREVRRLFNRCLLPDDRQWTDLMGRLEAAMSGDPRITAYLTRS